MARFFRRGVTTLVFCPTVTSSAAPTRAELTAGTKLKGISSISGFSISNKPVDVPDLDSRFTASVPGEDSTDASSLTFYDDNGTAPAARTALAKDVVGYIVYMPYGDVPTKRCEVWQVQSTGVNDQIDLGAAATFTVGLTPLAPPTQNAVVPA